MKIKILLLILTCLMVQPASNAQDQASKWQYGMTAGITSTRMNKGVEGQFFFILFTTDIAVEIDRAPSHYGFFANGLIGYDYNRRVRFQIEPGLAYANAHAVRRINRETNFFGVINQITETDRVKHKMLMAELPIKARFYFSPIEKRTIKNSLFMDLGFKLATPVVNKSTYVHEETNEATMTGKLTVNRPISLLCGGGISLWDKYTINMDWTIIYHDQFDIKALYTKVGFNYYFIQT